MKYLIALLFVVSVFTVHAQPVQQNGWLKIKKHTAGE